MSTTAAIDPLNQEPEMSQIVVEDRRGMPDSPKWLPWTDLPPRSLFMIKDEPNSVFLRSMGGVCKVFSGSRTFEVYGRDELNRGGLELLFRTCCVLPDLQVRIIVEERT